MYVRSVSKMVFDSCHTCLRLAITSQPVYLKRALHSDIGRNAKFQCTKGRSSLEMIPTFGFEMAITAPNRNDGAICKFT